MTLGSVDRVEAALAELTREDVAALPPARRRALQAAFGAWEALCDDILHPEQGSCRRPVYDPGSSRGRHGYAPGALNHVYPPKPAANDAPKSCGVLFDLCDGRGRQ
jgi:hypothetical protein